MKMSRKTVWRLNYRPHKGQQPFHRDRYRVTHRGIIAGTGSGKTWAGVAEDIYWCIRHPGIVGYVFEPSYPMVKRILIPKLEAFLGRPIESNPLIRRFNKSDLRIEWENGSRLWLGSLDDPESAEGVSVDFIHVDEPRLIPHLDMAIDVIIRRLRGSGGGHPIGSWWTTTPDAPGSPLHRFFEDPKERNPDSRVYRMSIYDNRENLPKGYIENVERRHTGGLADRFIWGRFAAVAEGVFEFDYTVHVFQTEDPGERNYVDPSIIRRMVYGVDWGWSSPAAIMAVGLDGDGRAYVLDEFYETMASDEKLIATAREFVETYGRGPFVCGHEEPKSIDKFRRAGLDAQANKARREDGIRELGSRFQDAGDGRRRLYIHRRCVNLISELQSYDPKLKENDHAVDGVRYALTGAEVKRRPKVAWSGRRR